MTPRVLLVEPDADLRERLCVEASALGRVDADSDFQLAKSHLLANQYDWVVTNLRLNAYNGLHLVHLAAAAGLRTRILVYADDRDIALAREAQLAGAFYELRREVHRALPAYLRGSVPRKDRRNAERRNGQPTIRRGRRCTDDAAIGSSRIATR